MPPSETRVKWLASVADKTVMMTACGPHGREAARLLNRLGALDVDSWGTKRVTNCPNQDNYDDKLLYTV